MKMVEGNPVVALMGRFLCGHSASSPVAGFWCGKHIGNAVSVRIVESVDAMTATAVVAPPELLRRIAERITRENAGAVARVLYDITDKPPATIEWE